MITDTTKQKFLKELERTALVAAACRVAGISRATAYRWRNTDKELAKRMDEALEIGRGDWSDLAESKLLVAVRKGEGWAIRYLLEFNHPRYYKPRKPRNAPVEHKHVSTIKIQVVNADGSHVDEAGISHPRITPPLPPDYVP
jgi:hypothetical protein